MKTIKRYLGLAWMLIGFVSVAALVMAAVQHIGSGTQEINKPLPWIIIIFIFTPIAAGMCLFGWYAWKGEYDSSNKPA